MLKSQDQQNIPDVIWYTINKDGSIDVAYGFSVPKANGALASFGWGGAEIPKSLCLEKAVESDRSKCCRYYVIIP